MPRRKDCPRGAVSGNSSFGRGEGSERGPGEGPPGSERGSRIQDGRSISSGILCTSRSARSVVCRACADKSLFFDVRRALAKASRAWFRVLHFSVQSNHLHLMLEARDKAHLTKGKRGLAIRVALSVNRVLRRRGKVWSDRYHARALRTPREVRHGLVYVLANWKKHVPRTAGLDPCSSAWWFDGWQVPPSTAPPGWNEDQPPVWKAGEWLSRVGWRRYGPIGTDERPLRMS